jgi:hypothetical protein
MIILGTNSIKDTGFDVANSCRFNRADSPNLTKTPSSSGDLRKWTWSCWVKRSSISNGSQTMFNAGSSANNQIRFDSDDTINFYQWNSGYTARLATNQKFRDVSAWYHIVAHWDTDNGTAGDRMKLFVNGTEVTSFATDTNPSQNLDSYFGASGTALYVGDKGNGNEEMDGYLAEVVFIDGQNLAPDQFGEFDSDSGIWKPIDVSGLTFGTNGFYLDFEDSSALGNDAAGSNNFTVNNLTAIDQSTDTCINNFATMNPLDVSLPSTFALSEGNLDALLNGFSSSGGNTYPRAFSTFQLTSGKWYAECKITEENDSGIIGISARTAISYVNLGGTNYDWLGINAHDYRYYHDGTKMNNNSSSSYGTTWDGGDTIGIFLDLDNLAVYFSLNGTVQASGDPTSGSSRTNAAFNLTAVASTPNGAYKIGIGTQGDANQTQGQWNFGSPPYAISSGNTDPNGFGNFEYSTQGYYALNTKNLAEFG